MNNEALYCGHKDGAISIWNIKTDTIKTLALAPSDKNEPLKDMANSHSQFRDFGHNGMVMCMVAMPSLQFIASGGMDGKLILWDTINNKRKKVYN
jgi:WD40 repeat protein